MNLDKLDLLKMILDSSQSSESWMQGEIKYFGPSKRSVSFYCDVNRESTLSLTSQLLELDTVNNEPIRLYINTEGGSLTDGFAIYDAIKNIDSPVVGIVSGICASAGLIILAACDYRMCTDNCIFFYHQPIMPFEMISSKIEINSLNSFYENIQERADNIIKKRAGLKAKDWNKYFKDKTSFYFDSDQAEELKIVDSVVLNEKPKFNFVFDEDKEDEED